MSNFTIEELEALLERYDEGAEWTHARIMADRKDSDTRRVDILRQLLSALKENRVLQAKIDAALAIPEKQVVSDEAYYIGSADGANGMRAKFRKVLEGIGI